MTAAAAAVLSPVSPCAPWCEVPDPDESSDVDLAHLAQTHPAWCCSKADLTDPDVVAKLVWAAGAVSSVLFRLSGLRFNGGCTTEEYLCLRTGPCGSWQLGWGDEWRSRAAPSGDGESWVNHACGASGCGCGNGRRVQLPYGPVLSIESVTINDALVPEENYRLVGDSLYLCEGGDTDVCFDACTGDGLLVAWTWGQAPPPEGITAACVMTCELYKSCDGQACGLPKRVRTVSRPGLSYEKLDPMDFLEKGLTGIYEVDLFLAAWGSQPATTVLFPEQVALLDFGSQAQGRW